MPTPHLNASLTILPRTGKGEDRAAIYTLDWGTVAVLADGAGGQGGGAEAADAIVAAAKQIESFPDTPCPLVGFLTAVDLEISADPRAGESTAVVVAVAGGEFLGASVGDSEAWLVDDGRRRDLTEGQRRKPLLGSRRAMPIGFAGVLGGSTLLLASDGLTKYVKPSAISDVLATTPFTEVSRELCELVRLRSGALMDDVSVILLS